MDDEQKRAFAEKCEQTNREFFPELYAETRYQVPTGSNSGSALDLFAEIIGLNMMFARDRNNTIADRIAASDVARKTAND